MKDSHKCVESIEEIPKLKFIKRLVMTNRYYLKVWSMRNTKLLGEVLCGRVHLISCKNFNIGNNVFQTTTNNQVWVAYIKRLSE